jgi:cytochrome c oxidase subunit 2
MRAHRAKPIGLLFPSMLLAACDGPQNYMSDVAPAAKALAGLGWWVMIVFLVVTAIVWLLIGWIARRSRGTLDWHAPVSAIEGQRWILVGGIAIPLAVLAIVFISALQVMSTFPMAHAAHLETTPAMVRVEGRQWWFNAEYLLPGTNLHVNAPSELHIPVGQPIEIALESRDVIHSFWVPKVHGKVDLIPGQTNRMRIRVDQPGRYLGQCGEYCGMQHAHMRIEVVAHEPQDYERWLHHQQTPAAQPSSEQARSGQKVFLSAACPLCHTVKGTSARGAVGPDLTHLASRKRIAGGMLINNTANLQAWVTNAQSLKPGSQMPSLSAFSGEELTSLVAYLQSLD